MKPFKLTENEAQYLAAVCLTEEPERRLPWFPAQFSRASKLQARADLNGFLVAVEKAGLAGDLRADWPTDFWLTRNRHGAGFWDGDYPDGIGERLSDIAHGFGEVWVDKYRGVIRFQPERCIG